MEGTREAPLEQIMIWANDASSSGLFWTHGLAGSGKSTIAVTVCERLRRKAALGGAFFCKRDVPEQRDARRILPTLASSLTKLYMPYRDLIAEVLEKEEDISATPLAYQLSTLFTIPLAAINKQGNSPHDPLAFVVDALDECGDDSSRSQIANCLCQIAALAGWLKVFVTSRPQPELVRAFSSSQVSLDLNSLDSAGDVTKYTRTCLQDLVDSRELDAKWLNDETINALSARAAGLFIWTSTMMNFVRNQIDKTYAMEALLEGQSADAERNLDALYMTVIRSGSSEGMNVDLKRAFLGIVRITAKNQPLSIAALCDFMPRLGSRRRMESSTLRAAFGLLRSVLYEDASKGNVVRVCHPSFLDFIESSQRCNEYWTNSEQLHQTMITKCFNIMQAGLRFNICALESSYIANTEVPDLRQRILDKIAESLQYSCLYWITHFTEVDRETVDGLVAEFFGGLQVLYWLEVLSLTGGLKKGLNALHNVGTIYNVCFVQFEATYDSKCWASRIRQRYARFPETYTGLYPPRTMRSVTARRTSTLRQ